MNNSTHDPALTRSGAGTDDGLKQALRQLGSAEDWNGPVGHAVLEQVRLRAVRVVNGPSTRHDVMISHLVDGLVGVGWEIMTAQRDEILAADRPWGFVVRALGRAAVQELRSSELVTSGEGARWARADGWHTARRMGMDNAGILNRLAPAGHDPTAGAAIEGPLDDGTRRWDPGLRGLRAEFVAAGASRAIATELINAALDVLQLTLRRSHVHYVAYRDPRLTQRLTPPQIRALVDLLIGSRRGGPEDSAWLALREAASAGDPVSLAVAHPQSLSRLRVLAQAWTDPSTQPRASHLPHPTPRRSGHPGSGPATGNGARMQLRATSGARHRPPLGCRARRAVRGSAPHSRPA